MATVVLPLLIDLFNIMLLLTFESLRLTEPVLAKLSFPMATVVLPLLIDLFNIILLLTFDSAIVLNDIIVAIAKTAADVNVFIVKPLSC